MLIVRGTNLCGDQNGSYSSNDHWISAVPVKGTVAAPVLLADGDTNPLGFLVRFEAHSTGWIIWVMCMAN